MSIAKRTDLIGEAIVSSPIKTIPESGQLVTIRGRRFCVTDVCTSTSLVNLVRSRQTANHHLVKLKSVEDDDLGAELEVIWELEIDAAVTVHSPSKKAREN